MVDVPTQGEATVRLDEGVILEGGKEYVGMHRERQTDRQTDRRTDRQTDRQTVS